MGITLLLYFLSFINAQIALPTFQAVHTPHTTTSSGTFTFTNCSATGKTGPAQSQVNSTYTSGNSLYNGVTINTQGIQEWTVPSTATYTIEVWGAQGGAGAGQNSTDGGGGTFVVQSNNTALIIAGGGGGGPGNCCSNPVSGVDGTTSNSGTAGTGGGCTHGNGGSSGNGGTASSSNYPSGAGGGLSTDGASTSGGGSGGKSLLNGGQGGSGKSSAAGHGGFGGGGGAGYCCSYTGGSGGGGGGYSGGGGSCGSSNWGAGGGQRLSFWKRKLLALADGRLIGRINIRLDIDTGISDGKASTAAARCRFMWFAMHPYYQVSKPQCESKSEDYAKST